MNVFFIEDNLLLGKYNRFCDKASNRLKKELYCKPIYNKKFLKTKIRPYGHDAEDSTINYNYIYIYIYIYIYCLAVVLLDSLH